MISSPHWRPRSRPENRLGGAGADTAGVGTRCGRAAGRIDFARDVQPIFQKHCYECHGPERQSNGLRLDRRKSVFMGGTEVILGRGSAQSSRLYLRLLGSNYGEQMPKDGTLSPAEIDTIKNWIDQGAEWPDEVSGDPPASPNGGTTPLMVAALRGDARMVRRLLASGADPNVANDAGATALMWAVTSVPVTRALVDAGADVNARSADARTPWLGEQLSCLSEAARIGDAALVRQVMPPTVKPDQIRALGFPLAMAVRAQCDECIDVITRGTPPQLLSAVMAVSGPPGGDATATQSLLARGADAKVEHPFVPGANMLMVAAASDATTPDVIRALLDRGVDPNAVGPGGMTALALARKRGPTPIVEVLLKAGARDTPEPIAAKPTPAPASSPRAAITRSLPLLQRADDVFLRKTGCVSCHNNSLTALTIALARERRIPVDEAIARNQLRRTASYLDDCERLRPRPDSERSERLRPRPDGERSDPVYQRGVQFLLKTQLADGSWFVRSRAIAIQPPLDADFPHGKDQFISAAATNWATQALIHAAGKAGTEPAEHGRPRTRKSGE